MGTPCRGGTGGPSRGRRGRGGEGRGIFLEVGLGLTVVGGGEDAAMGTELADVQVDEGKKA